MKIYSTIILLSLFILTVSSGQISFQQIDESNLNLDVSSGAPMGISDIDGDGLDDIISLDQTRDLFISYQNLDKTFNVVDYPTLGPSNWGMTIGDVTNNGTAKILTGGAYEEVRLVDAKRDGSIQVDFLDGQDIFVQAVSYFDINNDGFLDAVACHDDGPNSVYMNNGNGTLSAVATLPFMKFSGDEDNSGNYGNIWSDVNGDGLMDYYIAKCRQAVTDMTDVRRINQLWINNGDGTFTESAAGYGLDIGFQSWTAEFQDIDNDGDMDLFVTNHDGPAQLFENNNNAAFVDITDQSGIDINGLPIQAVMKDFDNDGFVDLMVTGTEGQLYRNNGDKTFTEIEENRNGLVDDEHSFAVGDLNHDGFLDMMFSYGAGFNTPSSTKDKLWLNTSNDNHWLAVQLEGIQSNREGVGSRIELYGDWGMMVREVRAGESYGTCHTKTQHFGIGASTSVDSIVVRWPSGLIDRHDNISIDQFIMIEENNCITPPSNIAVNGETTICSGDNVLLTAPAGFNYLWSNGQNTQSITVNSSGVFFAQITDPVSGCVATSSAIEVAVDPMESFVISTSQDLIVCAGKSVIISSDSGELVEWFDGSTSASIEIFETQNVTAAMQGTCGLISSNNIQVEVLPAVTLPINVAFEFNDDTITLTAEGENLQWFSDPLGEILIGAGNELMLNVVDAPTVVYVSSSTGQLSMPTSVGERLHEGSSNFNSDEFNGGMIFDVMDDILLNQITVLTDMAGLRTIQLLDSDGNIVEELTTDIPIGSSTVDLNFAIEAGTDYLLTTSSEQNIESFGFPSPRLRRSSADFGASLSYPYEIDNLISINGSNFGETFFYYFYDWSVSASTIACRSELVSLDLETNAVFDISENQDIEVYPNPSSQYFQVNYKGLENFDIRVLSLDGKEHLSAANLNSSYQIDLNKYTSGVFIMEMTIGEDIFYTKLVKI